MLTPQRVPTDGDSSANRDSASKFVQMLKETRALVVQAADQGKSADRMKQDHLLAKYEELGKALSNPVTWH